MPKLARRLPEPDETREVGGYDFKIVEWLARPSNERHRVAQPRSWCPLDQRAPIGSTKQGAFQHSLALQRPLLTDLDHPTVTAVTAAVELAVAAVEVAAVVEAA